MMGEMSGQGGGDGDRAGHLPRSANNGDHAMKERQLPHRVKSGNTAPSLNSLDRAKRVGAERERWANVL